MPVAGQQPPQREHHRGPDAELSGLALDRVGEVGEPDQQREQVAADATARSPVGQRRRERATTR